MFAIIGLGNPGSEYDGTRHNVGFAVVDAIAERFHVGFRAGKGEYRIASVMTGNGTLLVKPVTYMNNSGIAVRQILEQFGLDAERLLVVTDDFHLPLGSLRLRRKGSPAGHNGLASIIWHLNSDEFPRLRCGIDGEFNPAEKSAKADYVLSRFEKSELERLERMIAEARDTAIVAAQIGVQAAIDYVSRRKT